MNRLSTSVFLLVLFVSLASSVRAADSLVIPILYVEEKLDRPPVLSRLVVWPEDEGVQGAQLGINDNNTTGKFLKQDYQLQSLIVEAGEPIDEPLKEALQSYSGLVVANVSAETLKRVAALPEAAGALIFNARAQDNELRGGDCHANVLHTMASRRMLSDALLQFYSLRKWRNLFLIEGTHEGDLELAESFRQSAKKFGLKIAHDKKWLANADIRRTASQEIPVFTQARNYDALLIADEQRDFAPYLLYNTWLPRPIGGSGGLQAKLWSAVVEQWGAVQMQTRFNKLANRGMTSVDYANWAAVRAIGEAVTRTTSVKPQDIRAYLLSDQFELAGFKGAALSFRSWNGQLRQPIPLVHPEAVVASAPIAGFLHQNDELDTLGYDQPESTCKEF